MDKKYYFVFSYGTLQDENLQRVLFKRKITGKKAILKNHAIYSDETPHLLIKEHKGKEIKGVIFQITKEQLLMCEQWKEVPIYEKFYKEVFVEEESRFVKVIIYNKKPIGRSRMYTGSLTKEDKYQDFLEKIREFKNLTSSQNHELQHTDICIDYEFKSDQIFPLLSWNNKAYEKILKKVYSLYDNSPKVPSVLNAKAILGDKIVNFKLILESSSYNFCHLYLYFNGVTTNLESINRLISSLNIEIYLENKKIILTELLEEVGTSTEYLHLKKVYVHPYNNFDFGKLKKFSKYYPTFVLKNKYSIWHLERFEYLFSHINRNKIRFY